MKKNKLFVLSLLYLFISGCGALEDFLGGQLEDINGWDLSACVETGCGRETCLQLFLDNADKFDGGTTVVKYTIENLSD